MAKKTDKKPANAAGTATAKVRIGVNLSPEQYKKIAYIAEITNKTISDIVRIALTDYVRERDKQTHKI